jgi:hypothetical protein
MNGKRGSAHMQKENEDECAGERDKPLKMGFRYFLLT